MPKPTKHDYISNFIAQTMYFFRLKQQKRFQIATVEHGNMKQKSEFSFNIQRLNLPLSFLS